MLFTWQTETRGLKYKKPHFRERAWKHVIRANDNKSRGAEFRKGLRTHAMGKVGCDRLEGLGTERGDVRAEKRGS